MENYKLTGELLSSLPVYCRRSTRTPSYSQRFRTGPHPLPPPTYMSNLIQQNKITFNVEELNYITKHLTFCQLSNTSRIRRNSSRNPHNTLTVPIHYTVWKYDEKRISREFYATEIKH